MRDVDPTPVPAVKLRRATSADTALVLRFIRELAEYERMADQVVASEEDLARELFGPQPRAEVLIAELAGEPAGFALYFHNFSTFLGRSGIYLEDLYVRPGMRGHGIGATLLSRLAGIAIERGCGRFEWSVLDWNEPAIGFYRALGAEPMTEWTVFRVTGEALARLANRTG